MKDEKKKIAILGSTGSIGTQALEVVESNPDMLQVFALTAGSNAKLLIQQSLKFKPEQVAISDQSKYSEVRDALGHLNIKVEAGIEAISELVKHPDIDTVLTAMVGYSGLKPTIKAIEAGKTIALANKETLVVAGDLITRLAEQNGVAIYPVDSEHSAIFQCLQGEEHNPIEKIILTASGGPFRGRTYNELVGVTKEQALKHPNWSMGAKITIDSATLMNKGLEVIEAKWLFGLKPEQVEVIVHPQSIIHSIVQFEDGSMKAQMGLPDMKLPIQYALTYPRRFKTDFPRFDFINYPELTFEKPDISTFKNLGLAFESMNTGGNKPCVLNAANEVAVEAFLNDSIEFLEISDVVETCLHKLPFIPKPEYEDYLETDKETRIRAKELIS